MNFSPNSRKLRLKTKHYWLTYKKVRKMQTPRRLFVKLKKESVICKGMRLIRWKPIVRETWIKYCRCLKKQQKHWTKSLRTI